MMKVDTAPGYDRQLKRLFKKHYSKQLYRKAINALRNQDRQTLRQLKDHGLVGDKHGYRELHIQDNWLLVYQVKMDVLVLVLVATGTHDDIYK